MKTVLIFAVSTFFFTNAAFAHWDDAVTGAPKHEARAVAQASGGACATRYFTRTSASGKTTIRQSVDCQE